MHWSFSLLRPIVWLTAAAPDQDARAQSPDWAVKDNPYRIAVTVNPGSFQRVQCPVGVEVDFNRIFHDARIPGLVDRHSIRVVEYDPVAKRSVVYSAESGGFESPHQLTGDFPNDQAGRIWWRIRDEKSTHYHIYFDTAANGPKPPPLRLGLIGIGDSLHYNNGHAGPAPVHPLHSQYWHIDWDGDGKRDFIGFAYRRYEFGFPLQRNMGNGIYFLKNISTSQHPLFAPRYRLKDQAGRYLETDLLPQNMFPIDWDDNGSIDFIGVDAQKNLLWWENTGARDRNGLYVLRPPRVLASISAESDFRKNAPGGVRKPSFYIRAINPVDWHGDGGRDVIVSWANTNILHKVDSRKGVIPYGAPLMIFELLEDISADRQKPAYAPPRLIIEERGLPLNASTYATGGASYVDWDGDGDNDLLFHDETNRPLEGGRLMFAENTGTRQQPMFLMPIPILRIEDSPQVVDWTSDGRMDLIAGGEFFENVNPLTGGTRQRPVRDTTPAGTRLPRAWSYPRLVARGQAKQIQPEMLGHWATAADWDGNATLDIIRGVESHIQIFFNRGTNLNPVFEPGINLTANGRDIYMPNWMDAQTNPPIDRGPQGMGEATHSWLNPTVGDFDADNDLDLFVTSQRWQTVYFENKGDRRKPVLADAREVRYQGNPQEFSWRSKVSIGDLDADGVVEMVVTSDQDNVFYAYKPAGRQPDPTALEFDSRAPLSLTDGQPVTGWYGGQNNNGDNHSLLVDWDSDGDLDLINPTLWNVYYYENVGDRTKPRFRAQGKLQAGGADLSVFRHAGSVDAADWNGDGRLDLLASTENPSDQPLGEIVHLFDRVFLENNVPTAALGNLEKRTDVEEANGQGK